MVSAVDEVHCTVPATRSVRSFLDMAGAQWQASKPPTQPAYAHAELLLHHGNNVSRCVCMSA